MHRHAIIPRSPPLPFRPCLPFSSVPPFRPIHSPSPPLHPGLLASRRISLFHLLTSFSHLSHPSSFSTSPPRPPCPTSPPHPISPTPYIILSLIPPGECYRAMYDQSFNVIPLGECYRAMYDQSVLLCESYICIIWVYHVHAINMNSSNITNYILILIDRSHFGSSIPRFSGQGPVLFGTSHGSGFF